MDFLKGIIFFLATLKLSASLLAASNDEFHLITCQYTNDWKLHTAPLVYSCIVIAPFKNIVEKDTNVTLANDSPNNDHVLGINFDGKRDKKIVNFIPKGIEEFFPNLKYLRIGDAGLQEIHQEDLKPFPHLTHISFFYNNICVIEKGLFEFNPLLEFIWLEKNEIRVINPDAFKSLKKLSTLDLRNNACVSETADNNPEEVKRVFEVLDSSIKCLTSEYVEQFCPEIHRRLLNLMKENANSHVGIIIITASVVTAQVIICVSGFCLVRRDRKNKEKKIKNRRPSARVVSNQEYEVPKVSDDEVRYSMNPGSDHIYHTIRETSYTYDQIQRD